MSFWPLTVVILTKNEAPRIPVVLKSVLSAEKVLVLDSFSDDGTLKIAQDQWLQSARALEDLVLVQATWKGFVAARNQTLNWVTSDWVLWLDADEWIDDKLKVELDEFFIRFQRGEKVKDLYCFPRLTTFLGRPIFHGGWWPDKKARLLRRGKGVWAAGPRGAQVHESLVLHQPNQQNVGYFKYPLQHLTFRTVRELEETNDRYSTLLAKSLAQSLFERNESSPSQLKIAVKMVIKFIENYFWKMGILDGYPGFVIAKGSAKSMGMRLRKTAVYLEKLKGGGKLEE